MDRESVVKSIGTVEQYVRKINATNQELVRIINELGKKTTEIGSIWDDRHHDQFTIDFRQDIQVEVSKISARFQSFADYAKNICEEQRRMENIKRNRN